MKNSHSPIRKRDSEATRSLSERKRLSHLSGIKIVRKGKIPADIRENTEFYDLSILPAFTLCACYLGYANYKLLGEENADIPINLIWDLFNFSSGLIRPGRQVMDQHVMIIEKAFELFGFHADLSVKDHSVVVDRISKSAVREQDKTHCIGFDEKGVNPDIFSQMLMHALRRSLCMRPVFEDRILK